MSIKDQKSNLLNKIGALRSLNENFPKLKLSNSFPSLNNRKNAFNFLVDLLKTLIGLEQLRDEIVNILTFHLGGIESLVKSTLSKSLKKTYGCNINPQIPDWMIDGVGPGINIEINKFDLFNLMRINPTQKGGNLFYGTPINDLNRFIYETIQSNVANNWKNIAIFEFKESDPNSFTEASTASPDGSQDIKPRNNVINIKIDSSYQGKGMNTFLNDYMNSLSLFPIDKTINNVFDDIFGSSSNMVNKNTDILEKEEELRVMVNKFIDSDDDTIFDDSYFEFTNEEINNIKERSINRSRGISILKECASTESKVPFDDINDLIDDINSQTTVESQKTVLKDGLNNISELSVNDVTEKDKHAGKLSFFEKLIRSIILVIVLLTLSPKVALLFNMYSIITFGNNGFSSPLTFFKENKSIIKDLTFGIVGILITKSLLPLIIRRLKSLIVKDKKNQEIENQKLYQLQLSSLVGIPRDITDFLNNNL